jgi:hypothetical protein
MPTNVNRGDHMFRVHLVEGFSRICCVIVHDEKRRDLAVLLLARRCNFWQKGAPEPICENVTAMYAFRWS